MERRELYRIERPPIHMKSFGMPSKGDIEGLRTGDSAKVIFIDPEDGRERIWTTVISIEQDGTVEAELDNKPFLGGWLKLSDRVQYHVTDIIAVIYKEERI